MAPHKMSKLFLTLSSLLLILIRSQPGGRTVLLIVVRHRDTMYLVVLGCGQVGRALIEMVKGRSPLQVLAVMDSRSGVLSAPQRHSSGDGLSADVLRSIVDCKARSESLEDAARPHQSDCAAYSLDDAWNMVLTTADTRNVVVADCTASGETSDSLTAALGRGAGVVLANKKPISAGLAAYTSFVGFDARFRWESTVGAGSPFVTSFKRMVAAGDTIAKVSGVFSGTLGYVMTGLEDGKPLSEVVLDAKAQGFTEPDPRDDLGGVDFARKALILSRMMGWTTEMADVQIESLVPEACDPSRMPLDAFLTEGLVSMNEAFATRAAAAKGRGCVLRYAASIEGGSVRVGVEEVDRDSPLGRLRGTDNLLVIDSAVYDPTPLVIQGRGAGPQCTALGVLADALEIFSSMGSGPSPK